MAWEFQYVAPRPEPKKTMAEVLQEPIKKLNDVQAAAAAQASKNIKDAADIRNKAMGKLVGWKGNFEGWSNQDVDELMREWKYHIARAPYEQNPDQYIAYALQRMEQMEGMGATQATLMKGKESSYDHMANVMIDPSLYKGDGVPEVTQEMLNQRRTTFHEHTVYGNHEDIVLNGMPTRVGDYVDPASGMTKHQQLLSSVPEGAQVTYNVNPQTGVTEAIIMGANGEAISKPTPIYGPAWSHPDRGLTSWFGIPVTEQMVMPSEVFASTNVQQKVAELKDQMKSDVSRMQLPEARRLLKEYVKVDYDQSRAMQETAMKLWADETFNGTKPKGYTYNPQDWESGKAARDNWPTPEDYYLDLIANNIQFNVQVPQSGGSGSNKQEYYWADVRKYNSTGLPESQQPLGPGGAEEYKLDKLYGEQNAEIMRSLSNSPNINVVVPDALNLNWADTQATGKAQVEVTRIIPYYEDGYVLVEDAGADTEGQVKSNAYLVNNEIWLNDDVWQIGWKKKPEPRFIVVPIYNDKGDFSDQLKSLDEAVRTEYEKYSDIDQKSTPLIDLIMQQ
jgi:hypothetical protein